MIVRHIITIPHYIVGHFILDESCISLCESRIGNEILNPKCLYIPTIFILYHSEIDDEAVALKSRIRRIFKIFHCLYIRNFHHI